MKRKFYFTYWLQFITGNWELQFKKRKNSEAGTKEDIMKECCLNSFFYLISQLPFLNNPVPIALGLECSKWNGHSGINQEKK